jgi:hypothetical protein
MPITAKHNKSSPIADFTGTVTIGNSSGGTTTANASSLVLPSDWNSSHVITFTPAASEFTDILKVNGGLQQLTNSDGITFELADVNYFEPTPGIGLSTYTPGNQTWWVDPCLLPFNINSGRFKHMVSLGTSVSSPFGCTGTLTVTNAGGCDRNATVWFRNALYKRGTGNNTSRMESVWTNEVSMVLSQRYTMTSVAATSRVSAGESLYLTYPDVYDSVGGVTYAVITGEGSSSTAASTMAASKFTTAAGIIAVQNKITGGVIIRNPLASAINAGDYRMAFQIATSSALGGTTGINSWPGSIINGLDPLAMVNVEYNPQLFKMLGDSVMNSSSNFMAFKGFYATTSDGPPATIGTSDIRNATGNPRIYWNFEHYVNG